MACFARVARSAAAVELDKHYCAKLRERSASLGLEGHFHVKCSDYQKAHLDGDYVTWWQQGPLTNELVLAHLQKEQTAHRLRENATAAVLFDLSHENDIQSFESLRWRHRGAIEWLELVPFDERAMCETYQRLRPPSKFQTQYERCSRATGVFGVMALSVRKYARVDRGRAARRYRTR